jgi:SNF2 family DNA or RNA helicase
MPWLAEVSDEGHKALVFSQFTSFLAIVRQHLDRQGSAYEYLDGATRDRQACVARFQDDPACRLFLVSLKAGGLGLNLTAAEHVFILDPGGIRRSRPRRSTGPIESARLGTCSR